MRRESAGNTLQTTALVNEAYLRLLDQRKARFENRAHFLAIPAAVGGGYLRVSPGFERRDRQAGGRAR